MTPDRPVMFRAARPAATSGITAAQLAVPRFISDVVLLADVSEFQPQIADTTYLAWSRAIIIRAAYGAQHDDKAWYGGQRRDLLHSGGAHQYVTAFEDPAVQAHALVRLLGSLRPGEKVIGDLEEGAGDQRGRRAAWATVIHDGLGDTPWTYSGLNFAADHGLAPVDWVAAYGPAEPGVPHKLWQFTDAFAVPGVGSCDCSVFHGTIDQLAALAWQPAEPRPVPFPQPPDTEDTMIVLDALTSGGPAVVLPVPAGKTRVIFYADPGYKGQVQPSLRVIFNVGGEQSASPAWSAPAAVPVPKGSTEASVARKDDGVRAAGRCARCTRPAPP